MLALMAQFQADGEASLELGFYNLQRVVFCNWREVLVVAQQFAMMFECCGSNDAVISLAESDTVLAQLAKNVSGPNEYRFGHS